MNIVQIAPTFWPHIGGVENHVYELSRELARRGHRVTVLTIDTNNTVSSIIEMNGSQPFSVYRCRTNVGVKTYRVSFSLLRLLLRIPADLFHAHGYAVFSSDAAALSARLRGIPLVLTAHHWYFSPIYPFSKAVMRIYDPSIWRFTARAAARCIALTSLQAMTWRSMGIAKERIEIVPNGVRIRNTVGLNVRKTDSKGKLVVFIGRLSRLKSPSLVTAIRAWKRLVPEFPDAKLVIAGPDDAPERYSLTLRELVGSLQLENSVLLAGPVTEEQKAILLATSSIGLVVSAQEAFAITCLEFMAAKKPVIASRVGGIPFVVRDGYSGILVDNDSGSMESALRTLLSNTALAEKMGDNGRSLVTSSFSWESVSERLEKIYTDCVCQAHSFG